MFDRVNPAALHPLSATFPLGLTVTVPTFKIDLRWPREGAEKLGRREGELSDRTETDDEAEALAAYRELLSRDDLAGHGVAARFVVGGRSLYYSRFDRPFGRGRIHPDAPLDARADPAAADRLAGWTP